MKYLLRSLVNHLLFSLKERTLTIKVKYIFENNHSDDLVVVFSGFGGEKPVYNYVKSLSHCKKDKLFILDNFGYKGSYYWFENGYDYPCKLVQSVINQIVAGGVWTYYNSWKQ